MCKGSDRGEHSRVKSLMGRGDLVNAKAWWGLGEVVGGKELGRYGCQLQGARCQVPMVKCQKRVCRSGSSFSDQVKDVYNMNL